MLDQYHTGDPSQTIRVKIAGDPRSPQVKAYFRDKGAVQLGSARYELKGDPTAIRRELEALGVGISEFEVTGMSTFCNVVAVPPGSKTTAYLRLDGKWARVSLAAWSDLRKFVQRCLDVGVYQAPISAHATVPFFNMGGLIEGYTFEKKDTGEICVSQWDHGKVIKQEDVALNITRSGDSHSRAAVHAWLLSQPTESTGYVTASLGEFLDAFVEARKASDLGDGSIMGIAAAAQRAEADPQTADLAEQLDRVGFFLSVQEKADAPLAQYPPHWVSAEAEAAWAEHVKEDSWGASLEGFLTACSGLGLDSGVGELTVPAAERVLASLAESQAEEILAEQGYSPVSEDVAPIVAALTQAGHADLAEQVLMQHQIEAGVEDDTTTTAQTIVALAQEHPDLAADVLVSADTNLRTAGMVTWDVIEKLAAEITTKLGRKYGFWRDKVQRRGYFQILCPGYWSVVFHWNGEVNLDSQLNLTRRFAGGYDRFEMVNISKRGSDVKWPDSEDELLDPKMVAKFVKAVKKAMVGARALATERDALLAEQDEDPKMSKAAAYNDRARQLHNARIAKYWQG